MKRKTKIICTLGPATDNEETLRQLMQNGMNTARLNFSHGSYEEQKRRIDMVKKVREELNLPIPLLLDTKGPEIRIGNFAEGKVELKTGQLFTLTPEEIEGTNEIASISYKDLSKDVNSKTRILIDDGLIEMKVVDVKDRDIICKVLNGGPVSNHKSVNVPDVNLGMNYMSQKDIDDIKFGIENGVDFIAASFTRSAFDILEIRRILEENNANDIRVIAKIENRQGVNEVDEILKVSDGIMVARGDMGVEIHFEELPAIQKSLIRKCYRSNKMVITATQMLESMTHNPRPTRAETSDVANAVYDGTSAVMLSGETAVGKYPVKAIRTMARICEQTEADIDYVKRFDALRLNTVIDVANAISHSTCTTAHDLEAAAILTVTQSGYTARIISGFRPACPIIAGTFNDRVYRQLNLSWGVTPIKTEIKKSSDELFDHAVERALAETDIIKKGDLVAITGGSPIGVSGTTNILKVTLVGDILLTGLSVCNKSVIGKTCVAKNNAEALNNFKAGDILVIPETDNSLISILRKASAIITESTGLTSHAVVVGMTLDIPVLYAAKNATKILKNGTTITIDGPRGQVYSGIANIK